MLHENGVRIEAIRDIDLLGDGTVVAQLALEGSRSALRRCLEGAGPQLLDYQLTTAGDRLVLQTHYRPPDATRRLLEVHRRHAVVFDYPHEYVNSKNRRLRISAIGCEDELRSLVADVRELAGVEIEGLGTYDPTQRQPFTDLTPRQREVLRIAVERGYYDEPRRVTYEDIAAQLGCSAGAVGQHLRRAESRLVSSLVSSGDPDGEDPAPAPGTG
ncbi:helix-turn-helix domain-containing protein [Natrialbaceae archaeon GCM10025810]|uniref:helix-turn-helix domain-containing protein n=1 Tax=Halovalidus salilacus TaxID=3075124 RepID=UPI0036063879